jgi:phosphate transport system protein
MRDHFTQELENIKQNVLRMSILVEESISKVLRAIRDHNSEMAREVIDEDYKVNAFELAITDRCVVSIATEHPVATDLRLIVACLKAVSNIERIGDYVVHAARRIEDLAVERFVEPQIDIPNMLTLGGEMLRDAVNSLVNSDEVLARKTATRDEEIDRLNKKVHEVIINLIQNEKGDKKNETHLLILSQFLERLGDLVVNICGLTVYAVSGVHEDL